MEETKKINLSHVEKQVIKHTGRQAIYPPTEKIPCIVVDNFPMLGKITALRFIEWVKENPGGVISLPTGKTPEFFIKWAKYFLDNWKKKKVKEEFETYEIETKNPPEIKSLRFIQMDEFYPMDPNEFGRSILHGLRRKDKRNGRNRVFSGRDRTGRTYSFQR
ncbi:MAG: hypothetical protein P8Y30_03465 [candidate division WOR-3 bacterium]